jgi:hypothetical protein
VSDQPLTRAQIHRRIDKRLSWAPSKARALLKMRAKGSTAAELDAMIEKLITDSDPSHDVGDDDDGLTEVSPAMFHRILAGLSADGRPPEEIVGAVADLQAAGLLEISVRRIR